MEDRCAGCHQSLPESRLASISDGSIKVCNTCYRRATSMFFTEGADRQVPQRPSEPLVVALVSRSSGSRLRRLVLFVRFVFKIILELKGGSAVCCRDVSGAERNR